MRSLATVLLCGILGLALAGTEQSHAQSTHNFRTLVDDEPLPVLVSFVLRELSDISDHSETFVADFYLALRYQDPKALSPFTSTSDSTVKNIDVESIGIKPLTLEYINGIKGSNIYGFYEVFRTLSLTPDESAQYDEIPVNSSWGWVEYHIRHRGTFRSPFNLKSFPFDNQKLDISFEDVNRNQSDIVFYERTSQTADLHGLTKPSGFDLITHVHEASGTFYQVFGERYSSHTFSINLHRLSGAAFGVKIIGPMIITTVLSFFLFGYNLMEDKRHIPQATLFLAVVTYMFVIQQQLPTLPYTTRIDNFVLVSMLNNLSCFSWHSLARWVGGSNKPAPAAPGQLQEKNYLEAAVIAVDRPFCLVLFILYTIMGAVTMGNDLDFTVPVGVYLSLIGVLLVTMLSLGNGLGAKLVESWAKNKGEGEKEPNRVSSDKELSPGVVPGQDKQQPLSNAASRNTSPPKVLDRSDDEKEDDNGTVTQPFVRDPNRDPVKEEEENETV